MKSRIIQNLYTNILEKWKDYLLSRSVEQSTRSCSIRDEFLSYGSSRNCLLKGDIVIIEIEILQVAESTSIRAAAVQSVLDDRHEQQATEKRKLFINFIFVIRWLPASRPTHSIICRISISSITTTTKNSFMWN